MSTVPHVFSDDEVAYVTQLLAVADARARLGASGAVYFTVPLTDPVRASLQTRLGLDLSTVSQLPMRWIQGDTPVHVDHGTSAFDHTYLVYLNDSPGQFILDQDSYPIEANTAFVFSEGIPHRTQGTEDVPRLLVGPMNEMANPVGLPTSILYYNNYAAAAAQDGSYIAASPVGNYVLGPPVASGSIGSYTSWSVASINFPGIVPSGVFSNGFDLSIYGTLGSYFVYPATPCFKEGTRVLALVDGKETYVPIETLKKGDLVTTSHHGHKKVEAIGSGVLHNPGTSEGRSQNRLYRCSPARYGDLKTDLYVTGGHAILVDSLTEVQRARTIEELGRVFVTDGKARLLACVDERAEPAGPAGPVPIWHLALEHENPKMNYGIYVNGGLLVETCSINTLKHRSNLTEKA